MARTQDVSGQVSDGYRDMGFEQSIEITLSGTPGTVTVLAIPDEAQGIKIYPRANHIRFGIGGGGLAAVATSSSTPIATSGLAVGAIAKNDMWEVRLLPAGKNRQIQFRSTTGSVVVDVEVF